MDATLLTAFTATPHLPDALCRDRMWLYDQCVPDKTGPVSRETAMYRRQAVETCAECPALERCREWVLSMPRNARPEGVVGGLVITRRHKTTD